MSDAHHEHDGGHELENLDTGNLMKLVTALIVVVLISMGAVTQWFYKQRAELIAERNNAEGRFTMSHYHQKMDEQLGCDRTYVAWRRCPGDSDVSKSAARIVADPKLLNAGPRPAKFTEPETMYPAGMARPATPPQPAQPAGGQGASEKTAPVPGAKEPPVMGEDDKPAGSE